MEDTAAVEIEVFERNKKLMHKVSECFTGYNVSPDALCMRKVKDFLSTRAPSETYKLVVSNAVLAELIADSELADYIEVTKRASYLQAGDVAVFLGVPVISDAYFGPSDKILPQGSYYLAQVNSMDSIEELSGGTIDQSGIMQGRVRWTSLLISIVS